jgi:hypothetical protein
MIRYWDISLEPAVCLGILSAMPIKHVIFNGAKGGLSAASAWIDALNNAKLTEEKGGFLFKAAFDGDVLALEVVPAIMGNERSYHYNLHPKNEDGLTLIGDVTVQGAFTILVKPDDPAKALDIAHEYLDRYRRLAEFFIDAGYSGEGRLDRVTQQVLREFGIENPPKTLKELCCR